MIKIVFKYGEQEIKNQLEYKNYFKLNFRHLVHQLIKIHKVKLLVFSLVLVKMNCIQDQIEALLIYGILKVRSVSQ